MYFLIGSMLVSFGCPLKVNTHWYPASVKNVSQKPEHELKLNFLQNEDYVNGDYSNTFEIKNNAAKKTHFKTYIDSEFVAEKTSGVNMTEEQYKSDVIPVINGKFPYAFPQNIRRIPFDTKKFRKRCPTTKIRDKKQYGSMKINKKRFLEVFQIVEFEHVVCTSSSGLEGTCRHETECRTIGGSNMGTCADGYGTCCVIQLSCDERSAAKTVWFVNQGFPSPATDRLSCTVTIDKASKDIGQIRLDFVTFELLPPTAGTCDDDQFVVSGQNVNNIIPIICGINSGQHVYVEIGDVEGPIYLSVQTISPEARLFSIKVTQLTAFDALAAPSGCLLYFTEPEGNFESFNYRDKSEILIARDSSYMNNLNYAICIKRAPGTCSVTYTNMGGMQIVNYDTDGLPLIPPEQAGVEIFNCPSDWLLIAATRLCGDRLNDGSVLQDFSYDAPITDNGAGPLVVWYRSDGAYVGRGFKIQYQQNNCFTDA